jgi:hypothetical protein
MLVNVWMIANAAQTIGGFIAGEYDYQLPVPGLKL